jgi:hypothetical protein
MAGFQDYEIGWKGQSYVIPSNHLLLVIAAVEEHITLAELVANATRRKLPMVKVCGAYAAILAAAGIQGADGKAPIAAEEVYLGMFAGEGNLIQKTSAALEQAAGVIQGLLALMVPPPEMPKQPAVPGKSRAPSRPLRRFTKRRLARAG